MHLSLVTNVAMEIINEINKIQKEFIWNGNNPKIKHSTLCNKYENGGLKNVDILSYIIVDIISYLYYKLSAYSAG